MDFSQTNIKDNQTELNIFRVKAENILNNALKPDQATRKLAEEQITEMIVNEYPFFIITFGNLMLDDSINPGIRNLSSIVLKNTFHSNSKNRNLYEEKWLICPEKDYFRSLMESNLNCKNFNILNTISIILGSIARIEVSHAADSQDAIASAFFKKMLEGITNSEYTEGIINTVSVAVAQLYDETNYIFSNIAPQIYQICMANISNLSIIDRAIIANLECISISLDIFTDILCSEQEQFNFLNSLFNLINKKPEISSEVTETINTFVEFAIQNNLKIYLLTDIVKYYNETKNITQMCDFWTALINVDDEEDNLIYKRIIESNLNIILTKLYSSLTKEDTFVTEWTPHKASSSLLVKLTDLFGEIILQSNISQSFIIEKLNSSDSFNRAIGAIAIGSICTKGNSQFLFNSSRILVEDFKGTEDVSNEVLYAISRICEVDITAIDLPVLSLIIENSILLISNNDDPVLIENSIWIIYSIFESINIINSKNLSGEINNIIDKYFMNILTILISKLDSDQISTNIRNAVNSTLTQAIKFTDDFELLQKMVSHLFNKMHEILTKIYNCSFEEMLILEDVLSGYIVIQTEAVFRLGDSENIKFMENALLSFLKLPSSTVKGEVFLASSKLIDLSNINFISEIITPVLSSLPKKDKFLSQSALNLLCDIFTRIENIESMKVDLLNTVIPVLIDIISDQSTSLSYKASVMEVFGTIALVNGSKFNPYIEMAVILFKQINSTQVNINENSILLYNSIIKLMSCIVVSSGDSVEMRNQLQSITQELYTAALQTNHKCDKEILDFIADLIKIFSFNKPMWFKQYLEEIIESSNINKEKAKEIYDKYME